MDQISERPADQCLDRPGAKVRRAQFLGGDILLLEVDGYAAKFMTAQLTEGKLYQFTMRVSEQSQKIFNALSYDALRFN